MLRRALNLIALLPLAACFSDTPFCTTAEYMAPRSGFTLWVAAQGTVAFGEDLSQASSGTVRICPTGPAGTMLDFSVLNAKTSTSPDAKALLASLTASGFTADAGEVEEASRAIAGVLAGPKGTILPGQSKVLRVRSAIPRYEVCDLPVTPPCPTSGPSHPTEPTPHLP